MCLIALWFLLSLALLENIGMDTRLPAIFRLLRVAVVASCQPGGSRHDGREEPELPQPCNRALPAVVGRLYRSSICVCG